MNLNYFAETTNIKNINCNYTSSSSSVKTINLNWRVTFTIDSYSKTIRLNYHAISTNSINKNLNYTAITLASKDISLNLVGQLPYNKTVNLLFYGDGTHLYKTICLNWVVSGGKYTHDINFSYIGYQPQILISEHKTLSGIKDHQHINQIRPHKSSYLISENIRKGKISAKKNYPTIGPI